MKKVTKLRAFTLIEILVVVAIIGILATLSYVYLNNMLQKGRDTKRVTEISQIQNALLLYYRDEGRYPDTLNFGGALIGSTSSTTYMAIVPENPTPHNDGNCPNENFTYALNPTANGRMEYILGFCLAENTSTLTAGSNYVTPSGTTSGACATTSYTLTYTAGAHGSITGTSPQTINYGASGSAVTAVPDPGYSFVNWSDASTDNPRTDASVINDVSVTANFSINSYTLTYTAGSNGSLTGSTPQSVSYGGSGSAVTAVADSGYHFVDWSDASTDNPRTDANVTGDVSVTANFAVTPWACGDALVDVRDSQSYSTVLVGTQCWFKNDLNIGTRVAGTSNQGDYTGGIQKYCFNNLDANCTTDGGLYQWHMTMAFPQSCDNHDGTSPCVVSSPHQGICPEGWHVPSDAEWTTLTSYATSHGYSGTEGTALKATASNTPAWNGTDNFNFTALPTGYRVTAGSFTSRGTDIILRSATIQSAAQNYHRYIISSYAGVYASYSDKALGIAVRCLKD